MSAGYGKPPKSPGRPKGAKSKSTERAREALALLVENNIEKLQGWLDEIAVKDGPLAAFRCYTDIIEYHIPKLARVEHTGPGGGAIVVRAAPVDEAL